MAHGTGRPLRYVTSHLGQLSLAIPSWGGNASTDFGHQFRVETALTNSMGCVIRTKDDAGHAGLIGLNLVEPSKYRKKDELLRNELYLVVYANLFFFSFQIY